MDLSDRVEIVNILNINQNESTLSPIQLISNTNTNKCIISDADEELLILIKFNQIVSLKSITIHATNIDNDDDVSEPKQLSIYKLENLTVDFNDLDSLSADKTIECSKKKLSKGNQT